MQIKDSTDLVVRGERLFTDQGWIAGQIVVRDGVIVGLVSKDVHLEVPAVDAGENPVIPGLIDTHVHLRDPGYTEKEDFESGTRAAAAGGVTSVFDMPNVKPPTKDRQTLEAHLDNAGKKSVVDFGHIASGADPDTIAELCEAGASAIKVWMMEDVGRSYPHSPGTAIKAHDDLYRAFEACAEADVPFFVHPDDQDVYKLFVARTQAKEGRDFRSYARARRGGDSVAVNSGIATALEFQRSTSAWLHLLHLSSEVGVEMIRRAKGEGRKVTAEVNPAHLFVNNDWSQILERGPLVLGGWVPEDDATAVWEAVLDGTVDVIATDHGPHTLAEKEVGWTDMYAAPGGSPTIEHYLPLLLNAVNEGRLTLERLIELCCEGPARLMGLYRRKGRIALGADADFVILDMDHEQVFSAKDSHYKCGWMPWEGIKAKGRPGATFLRGRQIMEDGVVTAEAGSGVLLTREREPAA